MKKKITLLVEADNQRFAKRYARKKRKSVSAMFDDFVHILRKRKEFPLHPHVKKTSGIFKGSRDPWAELFGE